MQYNMNDESRSIPLLLEEWKGIKNQLENLYKNRNLKTTITLMEKGIELFFQFLFLSNGQQDSLKDPIPFNSLTYKPINVEERLSFIQSRPSLYQSFRQLCELMMEQEKLYVKKNIMKKASSPKKG